MIRIQRHASLWTVLGILGLAPSTRLEARNSDQSDSAGPIAQEGFLKASNAEAFDAFGERVAISGDTLVVGTRFEGSSATGVNGNQANNSAIQSGAVYVFVRNGSTWMQQAYIKASNTGSSDMFHAVAIDGDTLVVGAPKEDSRATGINGDEGNNLAGNAGAAYVFVRNGGTWTQEAYLKASNTGFSDAFGEFVAISGNTIVVGATGEDGGSSGVNGPSNEEGNTTGAAYVFVRENGTWYQQAYLKASNPDDIDAFGRVAISGDTIAVSATGEDSRATGINGDQGDNSTLWAGAVYVFTRSAGVWSQEAYVKASNTDGGDSFGISLDLDGDTLVVGAYGEDSNATGVGGIQSNNDLQSAGAAYVFRRTQGVWAQEAYLKAPSPDAQDFFGTAVAVTGDLIAVSATHEDSSSTGVNGDPANDDLADSGATYLYERGPSGWQELAYVKASNPATTTYFGVDVAATQGAVLIGSHWENSIAQTSGAAYVFDVPMTQALQTVRSGVPPNPNAFLPSPTVGPLIGTSWNPSVDHSFFAPGALADFAAISLLGPLNVPMAWGTLLVAPPFQGPVLMSPSPGAGFNIPVPGMRSLLGQTAWTQAGSVSPGPSGIAIELTNSLDVVFGDS